MRKFTCAFLLALAFLVPRFATADTVDNYLLGTWTVSSEGSPSKKFSGTLEVQERVAPRNYKGMIKLTNQSGDRLTVPVSIKTDVTNVFVTVVGQTTRFWPKEMAVTMGFGGRISVESRGRMFGYAIFANNDQVNVALTR